MTLERIPLEPYKQHQGEGTQLGIKGFPLSPVEQTIAEKVNEIIDYIRGVEATFGFSLEAEKGCCKDDGGQAHSDNDVVDNKPLDKLVDIESNEYKEDQLKGNEV